MSPIQSSLSHPRLDQGSNLDLKHSKSMDIHNAHGYPTQPRRKKGNYMQKKIKHENDIHWAQNHSLQGKNRDIPGISLISHQQQKANPKI